MVNIDVSQKLDIFLITYNRAKYLGNTLAQLFSADSPIKDFTIRIIDNNSTDNTYEVISKYQSKYSNLLYVKNKYNIGGNANIVKAFLSAEREYVWVISDDDRFNWEGWDEVADAIAKGEDEAIIVANTDNPKKNIAQLFAQTSFLPSVIYKTSNIDESVIANMQFNISNMFPHLAISAKLINEKKQFKIISKPIVIYQSDGVPVEKAYTRGYQREQVHPYMSQMSYSAGYANSLLLIQDKKIRNFIANKRRFYYPGLINANVLFDNALKYKNSVYNLICIFLVLDWFHKIKFIFNLIMFYSFYRILYIYRQDVFNSETLEITTYVQLRLFYLIKTKLFKIKRKKMRETI